MKWIIEKLKKDIKHKEKMVGTTAPSGWTQDGWDLKEQQQITDLKRAVKILKSSNYNQPPIKK